MPAFDTDQPAGLGGTVVAGGVGVGDGADAGVVADQPAAIVYAAAVSRWRTSR